MSTVEEHMNQSVTTARPDQSLEEGAQLMVERKVGATVILTQGEVVGIVSERDVMKAVARGMVPWNTKLEDLMTRDPVCAIPSMDVHEAIAIMLDHGFRHLPVVDNGKLVGIVSARHLLRAAEEEPAATRAEAQ
jgi:CBS domain-containing protein